MSRYFTSPPPVYARNWANGQNLVETTKIERQIVASRKVHQKEKKEKKKAKNEKSLKVKIFPSAKPVSDESEQLEKSCLTEEHGQRQHVGYLSDGSQNSKKRRRESSPAVESNIKATPVAGNPLRIRFVFKKPKEAEVVPQDDRVCSTSGTERPSKVSSSFLDSNIGHRDENQLSTSIESDKIAIRSESKKRKKHKSSKESRYNSLFDEWVPPGVSLFDEWVPPGVSLEEDNSNNDDWLFGPRRQEESCTKASINKDQEDVTLNLRTLGDYTLPRARFLSEVGIFSLPYTVPL